ncbi:hypothetical protein [uncultured Methylobacterium sp.]|jgi:hypothetical protein|uniref:hypothetical protein n=1 Tax=uncultured Methylobacterium sp. TaxID=157278 RepID=UPI0026158FA5|nr:hypothetical protein [uncultured Methylobacterium sp.]
MMSTLLKPGYQSVPAPAGAILSLAMPTTRTGGVDIVGTGGSLVIPDGRNAGSGSLNLKGVFDTVLIDRLRLDLPRDRITDGIGLWGKARHVGIRRSRITGPHGEQKKRHGDGIQVGNDAEIDTLEIEDTTICSAYQALIAHRTPNGKGLKLLVLRNVNVRDEPDLRKQMSIALLLGDKAKPRTGPKNAPYTIVLENVWVDWPSRPHAIQFPDGARVIGAINYGVPPGGDFSPA